ncbi:hypothetical protein RJT34_11046 [Clitoria ternatea]|uniref:Uncharacterized protein n=1 Tax=Clitoria ternatea TaxID=43366 RepID=A0AAN9JJB2_CLITE
MLNVFLQQEAMSFARVLSIREICMFNSVICATMVVFICNQHAQPMFLNANDLVASECHSFGLQNEADDDDDDDNGIDIAPAA